MEEGGEKKRETEQKEGMGLRLLLDVRGKIAWGAAWGEEKEGDVTKIM